LFDYPEAWNADICVLETDFPAEIHDELLTCMTKTPIGCTFLTYLDLKKLEGFNYKKVRQLDFNVYDSDRYLTSWSQGWRFYCWEHVRDLRELEPLPSNATAKSLFNEERVRLYHKRKNRWLWGKVKAISSNETRVEVDYYDGRKKLNCCISDNRIALHRPRFGIGEEVSAFHPDWAYKMEFSMFKGEVVGHNADGSYYLKWRTGRSNKTIKVPEHWVFARYNSLYSPGEKVLCCWTGWALNKNSAVRYKRYKAMIRKVNADGTYSVDFNFGDYNRYSDSVREMWITTEREEREYKATLEQWEEDPISSLCIQVARKWSSRCVATFLVECCHEMKIDPKDSVRKVLENRVGGEEFTSMNQASLESVLGMSNQVAKDFYGRFMYWVHTRMDNPPINAQKKLEKMQCELPGGGPSVSRMS